MADRRHEVGQGLAGAGAGLDGQMLLFVDRVLDGTRHAHLAWSLAPAEGGDGGLEKFFDRGKEGVRHGDNATPIRTPLRAGLWTTVTRDIRILAVLDPVRVPPWHTDETTGRFNKDLPVTGEKPDFAGFSEAEWTNTGW
ncbi:hypothetical protein GCM10022248_41790 [Nonomuraea soli]